MAVTFPSAIPGRVIDPQKVAATANPLNSTDGRGTSPASAGVLLSLGARLRFTAETVRVPGWLALARNDDGVRAGVAAGTALHHGDHLPSPLAVLPLEVGQDWSGRNLPGRCGVVIDVNSELLTTAAGAVGAVALVFIGGWDNGRRTRRRRPARTLWRTVPPSRPRRTNWWRRCSR